MVTEVRGVGKEITIKEDQVGLAKDSTLQELPKLAVAFRNEYYKNNARYLFSNVIDTSTKGFKGLGTPSSTSLSASGYYKIGVKELEIGNAESSRTEDSIFFSLGTTVTKHIYVKAVFNTPDLARIWFVNSSTNDKYLVYIYIGASTADFKFDKIVGGSWTNLATESVDLTANTDYTVEVLIDFEIGRIYVWRDNNLVFTIDDSDITQVDTIQFSQMSAGQSAKFKLPLVITYE